MCGIAGIIGVKGLDEKEFQHNLLKMQHRGPDSFGVLKVDELGSVLGHVRLSIIDVSNKAAQPMLDKTERYVLVFNGEIYNYSSIRNKLMNKGVTFKTNSDSEVIIEAYIVWKEKMLSQFEGMFAFSILDKKEGTLFIARDRFGVKPFYYSITKEGFYFASELKVIKNLTKSNTINQQAKYNYFKLGNVQANETIYKGIEPLLPGNYAYLNINTNKLNVTRYWSPEDQYTKERISLSKVEILEDVKDYLKKSFDLRMVSDVPVGVFLSGGIDSTLLASILKKELDYDFTTFTIGFDDPNYDESNIAKATSKYLGIDNINYTCSFEDFQNEFTKMYDYFDEPFADSSAPLTMLLSGLARQHVKVSLSADGGDEFFGGYSKYKSNEFLYKTLLKVPGFFAKGSSLLVKKLINQKTNNFEFERLGVYEMAFNILSTKRKDIKQISKLESSTFSDAELNRFLPSVNCFERTRYGSYKNIFIKEKELLMLHDIQNYMLDDILKKVDITSMSKSLEAREPFLDHNLFEFLGKIDVKSKFYGNSNKPILRELAYQYVPKEILDLPKRGFGAPLQKWSKLIIRQYNDFLYDSFIDKRWSVTYLDFLIKNSEYSLVLGEKLWSILNYLLWEEKYVKGVQSK